MSVRTRRPPLATARPLPPHRDPRGQGRGCECDSPHPSPRHRRDRTAGRAHGSRLADAGRSAIVAVALGALVGTTPFGSNPSARADDGGGREALTIDEVERQLDEAGTRIEALDAEIVAGKARRRALEAKVAESESRLDERRERVAGLEADIARFEEELAGLEASLARERAGADERRERLAATLRGTHRLERSGGLRSLLEHDDPALAARLEVYADYLLRAQRDVLDEQARALASIEAAHSATLRDRAWLEHLKGKAAGQRDAFAAARAERAERLGTLDEDLAAKTRSVAEIAADRERLQALMEELRELQSTRSGYFAAGRGKHLWPTEGRVEARFGEPKAVGKVRWNGLFVAAPDGAAVRAVADGEVVYADGLRGFGQLIIVDHGDGFMTLYGGNRDIRAVPGDWVDAGATIATVGDGSGQSESGVYFEIRENARPVDPVPWLGPEGRSG